MGNVNSNWDSAKYVASKINSPYSSYPQYQQQCQQQQQRPISGRDGTKKRLDFPLPDGFDPRSPVPNNTSRKQIVPTTRV
jgi:hypothetical protein